MSSYWPSSSRTYSSVQPSTPTQRPFAIHDLLALQPQQHFADYQHYQNAGGMPTPEDMAASPYAAWRAANLVSAFPPTSDHFVSKPSSNCYMTANDHVARQNTPHSGLGPLHSK